MTKPQNILFITADQWRGECLSALDHACVKTPNLDRLAADGVLFRRHYSQATPCGPGRASLYTGLYLHNHRSVVNGTPLDARHANIALESRKAGYDPVLFGYTDVSADPRMHEEGDPELTSYEGILPGITPVIRMRSDLQPWLAYLEGKGYEMPEEKNGAFRPTANFPDSEQRGPTYAPARFKAEDSLTAYVTDEAIKYISERRDEPWFVHISHLSPHPPFIVPEPYHELYDPADMPQPVRADSPEDEAKQHPWLEYFLGNQEGTGFTVGYTAADNLSLTDSETLQLRATYFAMMTEVDDQVGRLIAHLKETGEYDNTLIVFCSDHGEMLGDHWLYAKYGYFDQAFHTPLILRDPRPEADAGRGRVVSDFTENIDVMPTILDWIGVPVPVACDGETLLPFCRGENPPDWRSEAHWAYDFRSVVNRTPEKALGLTSDQCTMTVIRDDKYKYVHFTALAPLFFDLEADPWEQNDLAGDPAYHGLVLEYAQKMISWRMTHDERIFSNTLLTRKGPFERQGPRRSA